MIVPIVVALSVLLFTMGIHLYVYRTVRLPEVIGIRTKVEARKLKDLERLVDEWRATCR